MWLYRRHDTLAPDAYLLVIAFNKDMHGSRTGITLCTNDNFTSEQIHDPLCLIVLKPCTTTQAHMSNWQIRQSETESRSELYHCSSSLRPSRRNFFAALGHQR